MTAVRDMNYDEENAARGLVIGLAISLAVWFVMVVVFILLAVIL